MRRPRFLGHSHAVRHATCKWRCSAGRFQDIGGRRATHSFGMRAIKTGPRRKIKGKTDGAGHRIGANIFRHDNHRNARRCRRKLRCSAFSIVAWLPLGRLSLQ